MAHVRNTPIQQQVLTEAQRQCADQGNWTFTVSAIVQALPHLKPNTVRTHVSSRCCVNAPPNHPHRWPYFRRLERGQYEIEPEFRQRPPAPAIRYARSDGSTAAPRAAETAPAYGGDIKAPAPVAARARGVQRAETAPAYGDGDIAIRDAVHAVVTESAGWYVAECMELAVVTQAQSFDALLVNLREALALYMEGEDPALFGLSATPRLVVSYEARPVES